MKLKLITLISILTLTFNSTLAQQFNEEKANYLSAFFGPVLNESELQSGLTYTMKSGGLFAELSLSHFGGFEPSFTDLTATYGITINLGKLENYLGGRIGASYREGNEFTPLVGASYRVAYPIDENFLLGIQAWFDDIQPDYNTEFRKSFALYLTYKFDNKE